MISTRRTRQAVVVTAVTLLATAIGVASARAGWLDDTLQARVSDTFVELASVPVGPQLAVIAIDDATIARYGRWPLPRQAYVDVLQRLREARPTVVAFDVVFYDPSDRPDDDRALADAIRQSGNVVLAMQGSGSGIRADGTERFASLQLPMLSFRQAAADIAAVNVHPDGDGRVRQVQAVVDGPAGRFYALPIAVAMHHLRADLTRAQRRADTLVVPSAAGPRVVPVDERGEMPIHFFAPPAPSLQQERPKTCADLAERFCVVSLADVVSGEVSAREFAGRAVLIGVHSASALPDDYPVPTSGETKMFGVEIWANATQSILTGRYVATREGDVATAITVAAATIGGVLLVMRFRIFGFMAALAVLVLYAGARFALFEARITDPFAGLVPVASLAYALPAIFWWVMVLGYLLLEEQLNLARAQTTFGRFVTPAVARTIMEREESGRLRLGGEAKRVTVLFGDIRGFTTLSEDMDPARLLDTLNRYFEGMVAIVERYGGSVNKFNGDNIMVIWGAPLEADDGARRAVSCALEIQRWIVSERARGGPDVSFGFGINTGVVVAGFLGSKGRMEYTVIGDTANVASRLTSADIAKRDNVAVSGATLAELGDDVSAVDLGAIAVKGRTEPVRCYQIDRLGTLRSPNPAPAPERIAAPAGAD